ncbi:sugar ABC transporter permease [Trinickia sp. NRRL B-1857]|uniref:sugar ABC transporter permease n=1 Tax=Trinickia sp. NRRL B-1857 TaxID=3162879 RepID=UPI003D2E7C5C
MQSDPDPQDSDGKDTRTVSMSIRIGSSELSTLRRTLHQVLGPELDVYTAVVDKKRDCATLQVILHAQRVHQAMTLIMGALPEAEFGPIRSSVATLPH